MSEPGSDDGPRWLPWLLIPVSLLSNPAAAFPWGSYFFRDFGNALLPLRLFAAREWAAGRWPAWNPYLHEGTFLVPTLYPLDLLHALGPSPNLISWLLTLHFPMAALSAYVLARDLGAGRRGAFVAGAVYSLGGLAVASLNLYFFLQALAWAPALAASLRRAALLGGRWVAVAALLLGCALPILALEFLGQGVLFGVGLVLVERRKRDVALRLILTLALGIGLAALPIALTTGFLPETARGAGFVRTDALEGETPPAALVQTFVLGLFGSPSSPFEGWWSPFYKSGSPYFLTLYLGPLALALAATGLLALDRPRRFLFFAGIAVSVWFALGEAGGLAPLVQSLPGVRSFRTPSKAFFFSHLAVGLLAGFGLERLWRHRDWRAFGAGCAVLGVIAGGLAALLLWAPENVANWLGLAPSMVRSVGGVVAGEALQAGALTGAGLLVTASVAWGRLRSPLGALLVAAVAILDLARAGAGVNPQAPTAYFDILPELASHVLPGPGRGRVFTYGIQWSPAFRAELLRRRSRSSRWIFWLSRQLLVPYVNVLDGIESAETPDLTGMGPAIPELLPEDYDPSRIGRILPRLRSAGVARVLSLDALEHDGLLLIARVPLPESELVIHVYGIRDVVPPVSIACRAIRVTSQEQAFRAATSPGFAHALDVALEEPGPDPGCRTASVIVRPPVPTREGYEVESDGAAFLVVRNSFARGWTALVDGSPVRVLRANGKYRAIPVPAGRHEVVMSYRSPGLSLGLGAFAASALVTALVAARRGSGAS